MSAAELAAFVADLWVARGWETDVEGRTVVATDGRDSRRLLIPSRGLLTRYLPGWLPRPGDLVPGRPDLDADHHDAIVVRSLDGGGGADGTRVIDASELREMALYAVDPDARDRLFDSHVGLPPTVDAESVRDERPPVRAPVMASVILMVAAAAFGAAAYGSQGLDPPAVPTTDAPPDSVADPTTDPGTATDAAEAGGTDVERYPIGIGPDGVEDVNSIVVSHVLALAQRSHRWEIAYREVVDGRTRGFVRETVWVENSSVYRSKVEREGSVESSPAVISGVSTYAHGITQVPQLHVRYERIDAGEATEYRRQILWPHGNPGAGDLPTFYEDPIHVIERYLSVDESWTVNTFERNGTRYYQVAGRGDSLPRTTDIRVNATVGEHGLIHRLRRTHRSTETGARIVVTFRLSNVGNTTVTPPPWLGNAKQAIANRTQDPDA